MNKYILGILKKMAKHSDIKQTEAWTESKMQMISTLTKKIQKIKVDQHFKDVDVNDFHVGIHSWVSWFSLLTFQKTSFQTNLMDYVIYCQNDRNKKCNQVSIHLCSLLFFLIFSLGLVICLLPSPNIDNEEIAEVKAISNSPGNFENSNIWIIFISYASCTCRFSYQDLYYN